MEGRFMVTGIPDKELGEKLVLIVEGKVNKTSMSAEIESLTTLGKLEKPKEIFEFKNFLNSESGKLLRKDIKAAVLAHSE